VKLQLKMTVTLAVTEHREQHLHSLIVINTGIIVTKYAYRYCTLLHVAN